MTSLPYYVTLREKVSNLVSSFKIVSDKIIPDFTWNPKNYSGNKILDWIGLYFNLSFGHIPIKFNKSTKTFSAISPSPLLKVQKFITWAAIVYEAIQFALFLSSGDNVDFEAVFILLCMLTYILIGTALSNFLTKSSKIVHVLNQLSLKGYPILNEGWQKPGIKTFVFFEVLLSKWLVGIYSILTLVIIYLSFYVIRGKHIVATSGLELLHLNKLEGLLRFIQCWIVAALGLIILTVLCVFTFLYSTRTCLYLHMIRKIEVNLEEKIRTFNGLRILNILFNDCPVRSFVPSYVYAVVVMGSITLFALVKQNTEEIGNVIVLAIVFVMSLIALTLPLFSYSICYKNSSDTLNALRKELSVNIHSKKYCKQMLASTTAFGVRYGVFQVVKHKHTLDCFDASLNIVTSLLISSNTP